MSPDVIAGHDARGLAGRFLRLAGAVGVEGALSAGFLLYLAWRDSDMYGALMYGLAAAVIIYKVVQLGLYYPLVTALGEVPRDEAWRLVVPVAVVRLVLSLVALAVLGLFVVWRALPTRTALTTLALALGFAVEALATTAFAELRLRGQQHREARLRVVAAIVAYGYGFLSAALGAPGQVVALFKLVGALVLLVGVRQLIAPAGFRGSQPGPGPTWRKLRPLLAAALALGGVDILGTLYNKTNVFFLEAGAGAHGVALYSATWNVVDAVSLLASEQFLAAVVFPSLAALWAANRPQALAVARQQALGLGLVACAVMFVLHQEATLIVGCLYPGTYAPAAALQRILVWTIALSFANNLFASLMIASGAVRTLLTFAALTAAANLLLNASLVRGGADAATAGACWVIVLTKLVMTLLTVGYCQWRFRLLALAQLRPLLILPALGLGIFWASGHILPQHAAVLLSTGIFAALGWRYVAPRSSEAGA
jgi:O-antigen/teichoic acid export membrane protein